MSDTGREMSRHALGNPTVRIGSVLAVPALLRSLGADPAEVLAEAGIDPSLFDDPDNFISHEARGRLLSRCVSRTRCPHFGLLVGQRADLRSLGLVGLLVRHSPDVETALRNLIRYAHLFVRGAAPALTIHDEAAILSYEIYQPDVEGTDQLGDGSIALMTNAMRTLCGPDWQPSAVWLAHRKPEDVRPFRRFFRAPLHFEADQNALVFSRKWLTHRPPSAEMELRRLLQSQVDALEAERGDEFAEQVRRVLRAALLTGHGNADQVAALFSMHSRTLNRRLRASGTCFREIVDECRFAISRQMLHDTALDVTEIAAALDYADASAFTRAFRRWSGTTPAAWRATRGQSA